MNYLKLVFIERKEGKTVLFTSILYLVVGCIAKLNPALIPSEFYRWMCFMMPIIILIVYIQMPIIILIVYTQLGGYRKNYKENTFNTIVLCIVAIMPILVNIPGIHEVLSFLSKLKQDLLYK